MSGSVLWPHLERGSWACRVTVPAWRPLSVVWLQIWARYREPAKCAAEYICRLLGCLLVPYVCPCRSLFCWSETRVSIVCVISAICVLYCSCIVLGTKMGEPIVLGPSCMFTCSLCAQELERVLDEFISAGRDAPVDVVAMQVCTYACSVACKVMGAAGVRSMQHFITGYVPCLLSCHNRMPRYGLV